MTELKDEKETDFNATASVQWTIFKNSYKMLF
jgi:hypothetical protein